MSPTRKEAVPIILGKSRSVLVVSNGYPWVVRIIILVIAKIEIIKPAQANVKALKSELFNLESVFVPSMMNILENENPPNKVLIKINWLARVFPKLRCQFRHRFFFFLIIKLEIIIEYMQVLHTAAVLFKILGSKYLGCLAVQVALRIFCS